LGRLLGFLPQGSQESCRHTDDVPRDALWLDSCYRVACSIGKYDEVLHISAGGRMSILILGIFCWGFIYIFWYNAFKKLTDYQVGSLQYIEPLVAVAVARSS
jgi:hypothetical protein